MSIFFKFLLLSSCYALVQTFFLLWRVNCYIWLHKYIIALCLFGSLLIHIDDVQKYESGGFPLRLGLERFLHGPQACTLDLKTLCVGLKRESFIPHNIHVSFLKRIKFLPFSCETHDDKFHCALIAHKSMNKREPISQTLFKYPEN